jgi:hypothetical protein
MHAAADASDEISWGVRAAQHVEGGGDAGASGRGEQGCCSRSRQARHPAPCGHELCAASEARLWHRDRHLHALRRPAQGDRQHRRAGSDREDSGASAEGGPGSAASRTAARGASASPTGAADLTLDEKIRITCREYPRRARAGSCPKGWHGKGQGTQAWWCSLVSSQAGNRELVGSAGWPPEGREGTQATALRRPP